MPIARFWKRCGALGTAMVIAACAGRDVTSAVAPVTGATANRATYAYSTPYGEMYEENGELVPAGYAQPWDAVIADQKTSLNFASSCSTNRCDVVFTAWMIGLWHTTKQTIDWSVGGKSGNPSITNTGWTCAVRFGPLNCGLAERTNAVPVRIDGECHLHANVSGNHEAWWGAWFDLSIMDMKFSQAGHARAYSIGMQQDWQGDCGSSGGADGYQGCWVFILCYWDINGQYREEEIDRLCFGGET